MTPFQITVSIQQVEEHFTFTGTAKGKDRSGSVGGSAASLAEARTKIGEFIGTFEPPSETPPSE